MTDPKTATDWADLDARLRDLQMHAARTDERLERGDERMGRIEASLDRLTEMTQTIADFFAAGKAVIRVGSGVGSFAGWLAKIIALVTAVWGAVYAATHGGARPPGH